jgi:hypothetical protein
MMQLIQARNNPRFDTAETKAGWLTAYKRFLFSREESVLLKLAPLALIGILPEEILSNLIPGLGLLDDAGYVVIVAVVLYKTVTRVNRYR